MSWSKNDRNFPPKCSAMTALAAPVSARFVGLLQDRFGPLRHAEKLLARMACSTPRSARNWLDGDCAPRIEHVIELMAADPVIEAAVLDMVAGRRAERGST